MRIAATTSAFAPARAHATVATSVSIARPIAYLKDATVAPPDDADDWPVLRANPFCNPADFLATLF